MRRRSALGLAVLAAGVLAGVACGKAPSSAVAAPSAKKRAAPDPVDPVVIGSVRYEAPPWGKAQGLGQNGGIVVAHDVATGAELWSTKVYTIAYKPDMEADKQDVFIIDMKASADGKALVVADDRGRRWRVDLASHAAGPDTSP
jgi:hypothetical protein